jgi:16S rRNA U516 pseudouridylate synthase RsuA-like enzyme
VVGEERVQRALARAGFGSRRACEQLIADGRVMVDGVVATLGDKVDATVSAVLVDGLEVNLDPDVRYYALHKPPGVVTTMRDPQGRPDIRGFLPSDGSRFRRAAAPHERRRPREPADASEPRRGEGVPGRGRG